jgi:hypothetical protein
LKFFYFFI